MKDYSYFASTKEMRPSVKTIEQKYQEVNLHNLVGYCVLYGHPGYLTKALMKEHECKKKGCPYLVRFEGHPYWESYREKRENKKESKRNENAKDTLNKALAIGTQSMADSFNFPLLITSVNYDSENHSLTIYYVSKNTFDDHFSFVRLSRKLRKEYGLEAKMIHIKKPDGRYATINDCEASHD